MGSFLLEPDRRRGLLTPTNDSYDSPWKDALEEYFTEFLVLFFPEVHGDIDWSLGYTFLDKELQQVTRNSEAGPRLE